MTAICGILSRGDVAAPLAAMLEALDAYGTQGGAWTGEGVGLGVRHRPSAAGEQDVRFYGEAGLALVADVRLDDRETLCAALGVPYPDRADIADGALLLRAYRRWGEECPHHLLGDYAFAVWNTRTRTLFCARDHVGVRPFYYAATAQGFVCASAVEAVLAAPFVSDALDETTAATFLTRISLTTPTRTFFRAVRKLPPGHTLTVDGGARGEARLQRYWHPERAPRARPASDDAYAEEFLNLYAHAVSARLRGAADPVGVHLSGGLDSSSIAVLAARALRRQGRPAPLAFSWLPALGAAPPSPAHASEYALIDAVCERERMSVCHRSLGVDDVVAVLARDGSFPGVHVHLNEDVVQRAAAERGVRVLLSGWGGDEGISFNGRGYDAHLLLSGRWRTLAAASRARGENPVESWARVVLSLIHPRLPRTVGRLRRGEGVLRRRWLIDPAFARRANPGPGRLPRFVGVRRTRVWLLQHGGLSARMEGWAAGGARRGLEYRYPLLDRRVLEFALGLPAEQFRRGQWTRWLMRYALRSVLPPEICWNPRKNDPARLEPPLLDAFAAALPVVRRMLDARAKPPSRARYVDLPRLRERLDADRFRANPQFAPLANALQFLDF